MKAEDVMTTSVIMVTEHQAKQQAARLLSQHRIRGLPVVNDDKVVVGLVTEYDVMSKEGQTVGEIMTRGVISVTQDTDLEEVSHLFVHERISRLPVLAIAARRYADRHPMSEHGYRADHTRRV